MVASGQSVGPGELELSRAEVFSALPADHRRAVAQRLERRSLSAGEVIYREGDESKDLFLIAAGTFGAFRRDANLGLDVEVERYQAGECFGEADLLASERRASTVRAVTGAVAWSLERALLLRLIERFGEVGLAFGRLIARRNRALLHRPEVPTVDVTGVVPDKNALRAVPAPFARARRILPLSLRDGVLVVACVDPTEQGTLHELGRMTRPHQLRLVAIAEDAYERMVEEHRRLIGAAQTVALDRLPVIRWSEDDKPDTAMKMANQDEVKSLVDRIVVEAIERGASDVHLEPSASELVVRYRLGGALVKRPAQIPQQLQRGVASRIKVLAKLDISERRTPQDGRMSCEVGGRHIDLRVSTLPTIEGENIVLRVLDSSQAMMPLEHIISAEKVCMAVRQMVARQNGVVYVCGPTGSGKSTTLYSALNLRRGEDVNITTVEDPVEYELPGVVQVSVNAAAGLTFPSVLRAILRQDVDVILVGEIRDLETAKLVLEAGMTGHLVLTSLHTRDSIGTIARLHDMGLPRFAIASALVGIISQRLVRRVCPHCSAEIDVDPRLRKQLELAEVLSPGYAGKLRAGKGCERCAGTGFKGRVGAYEVLVADDALRARIAADAGQAEMLETARTGAFVPMASYVSFLLTKGYTSAEDSLVVASSHW